MSAFLISLYNYFQRHRKVFWGSMFLTFALAAYFAAVAKSPVTAAVLIMEITGSTHYMLTLVMVSMTAYRVADMAGGKHIYEQLLEYSLNKKK